MENGKKLNHLALWPALALLAVLIGFGVFKTEALGSLLTTILYGMADKGGWFFCLFTIMAIILTLVLALTKIGDIKIGGPNATPDYKTWNWITMSLCGGIGTGLLFWAMGEPMYHFMTPPVAAGVEAGSRGAAIFAISQAMWQWSIPQYCLYTICAVAFALTAYNMKKPLAFGPVLDSAFGKKSKGLETFIHGLSIFTMCGAVACSMGVGLMQIGAGLANLLGLTPGPTVWLIIAVVVTAIFTLSCVSGIGTGLKKMSSFTTIAFIGILIYIILFGPSGFSAKLGTEALATLLDHPLERTAILNTMAEGDTWAADWEIQYWASFIVYAPIIGMFLSRMAKGRTLRQFILVNVLAPSIFCMVWIAIFGGVAINMQVSGSFDIWNAVNTNGMEATIFFILDSFPLGKVLIVVFLVAICTSFSTLADPMAAACATMSVHGLSVDDEAPKKVKILIGVIMGAIAYILVASGGIGSVKGMWVIIGLPIAFVQMIVIISAFRNGNKALKHKDYMIPDDIK